MSEKTVRQYVKELNKLWPRPRLSNSPWVPGVSPNPNPPESPVGQPGNRTAAKENLSPEAHERRMEGLRKTWRYRNLRKRKGQKIMTHKAKKKLRITRRKRQHERVALEFRQLQDEARKRAPDILELFDKIMASSTEPAAAKIAACVVLLDRGYGKANQPNTNVNIDANGKPSEISSQELEERIRDTIKRVEGLTGGAPQPEARKDGPADIRKRDGDTGGSTLH